MNKKLTVVVILAMLVVATGFSVSGTYAKYTSQFSATDNARVAKWAVSVGGKNGTSASRTFDFNLFTYTDTNVDVDGVNDNEKVIAPGTTGTVPAITIANDSEVNAEYTVEYTISNDSSIPVEFSTDGGKTWVKPTDDKITVAATPIAMGAIENVDFSWRWVFEGKDNTNYTQTDTTDTDLGVIGTASITVSANVVVTQVD